MERWIDDLKAKAFWERPLRFKVSITILFSWYFIVLSFFSLISPGCGHRSGPHYFYFFEKCLIDLWERNLAQKPDREWVNEREKTSTTIKKSLKYSLQMRFQISPFTYKLLTFFLIIFTRTFCCCVVGMGREKTENDVTENFIFNVFILNHSAICPQSLNSRFPSDGALVEEFCYNLRHLSSKFR